MRMRSYLNIENRDASGTPSILAQLAIARENGNIIVNALPKDIAKIHYFVAAADSASGTNHSAIFNQVVADIRDFFDL